MHLRRSQTFRNFWLHFFSCYCHTRTTYQFCLIWFFFAYSTPSLCGGGAICTCPWRNIRAIPWLLAAQSWISGLSITAVGLDDKSAKSNQAKTWHPVKHATIHNAIHPLGGARLQVAVQRSAKFGAPGLVNFVTAVAYHFCPSLPAAFTQPSASILTDLCICKGS